jgi:hypothetical protein
LNIKATAEEVKALFLLWQGDAISYDTFYDGLMRGEWAPTRR